MTVTASEKLSVLRQAATDAREHAEGLRARIRAGDGSVTGRQLAEADASIEVAELRAAAAEAEAEAEQEADRVRTLHAAADRYLADEGQRRQAFAAALADLEAAFEKVLAAGVDHRKTIADVRRASTVGGSSGRVVANPRTGHLVVDGSEVRDVTVAEWLRHLSDSMLRRAGADEGRALWPAGPTEAEASAPQTNSRPWQPWTGTCDELRQAESAERERTAAAIRTAQTSRPFPYAVDRSDLPEEV